MNSVLCDFNEWKGFIVVTAYVVYHVYFNGKEWEYEILVAYL